MYGKKGVYQTLFYFPYKSAHVFVS